jgi:hypothetical protein
MSYESVCSAMNPDQYWTLRGDGDATIGAYDGVLNGPTTAPAVLLQDKATNPSLHLDGVNDYVSIPPGTPNYAGPFSAVAWVRPTGLYVPAGAGDFPVGTIIRKRDNWWLMADSLRGFSVNFLATSGGAPKSASSANFGDAYHWEVGNAYFVAGTFDGTLLRIYVNGLLSQEINVAGSVPNTYPTYEMRIGNRIGTPDTSHFKGDVGHCATWGRALSGNEITSLYEAGWYAPDPPYKTSFMRLALNHPPPTSYLEDIDKLKYIVMQCWATAERGQPDGQGAGLQELRRDHRLRELERQDRGGRLLRRSRHRPPGMVLPLRPRRRRGGRDCGRTHHLLRLRLAVPGRPAPRRLRAAVGRQRDCRPR